TLLCGPLPPIIRQRPTLALGALPMARDHEEGSGNSMRPGRGRSSAWLLFGCAALLLLGCCAGTPVAYWALIRSQRDEVAIQPRQIKVPPLAQQAPAPPQPAPPPVENPAPPDPAPPPKQPPPRFE